jgi:hypothetical protein
MFWRETKEKREMDVRLKRAGTDTAVVVSSEKAWYSPGTESEVLPCKRISK